MIVVSLCAVFSFAHFSFFRFCFWLMRWLVPLIMLITHGDSVYPFFKKKKFIYYLAVPGLSWSLWDLASWPGIELGPLHWELGVLATGPPGKSLNILFCYIFTYFNASNIWLLWILFSVSFFLVSDSAGFSDFFFKSD